MSNSAYRASGNGFVFFRNQSKTIAHGKSAGATNQGEFAIAIGCEAGKDDQGEYAIAIGAAAGKTSQFANSIVLTATKDELNPTTAGLFVKPIRSTTFIYADDNGLTDPTKTAEKANISNILCYDVFSNEVVLGIPRLPSYASDALATAAIAKSFEYVEPPAIPTVRKTPKPGKMYFNTATKKIKVYNGTKWVALLDEDDLKAIKKLIGDSIAAALTPPV